jgi:hypothetical protein
MMCSHVEIEGILSYDVISSVDDLTCHINYAIKTIAALNLLMSNRIPCSDCQQQITKDGIIVLVSPCHLSSDWALCLRFMNFVHV